MNNQRPLSRETRAVKFLKRTVAAQIHLLGFFLALVGLIVLLKFAAAKTEDYHFYACLIFGMTSMLVFGVSTTYHFMYDGFHISSELEKTMENLDHYSIYLFIAGTYTPLVVNAISPRWEHILLWLVWSVCLAGIIYTSVRPKLPAWAQHRYFNTSIFVVMGWILFVRLGEALSNLNSRETFFLAAGAASYTIGAAIYALKKPNFFPGIFGFHELWHLLVLAGFAFHYLLILNFYS